MTRVGSRLQPRTEEFCSARRRTHHQRIRGRDGQTVIVFGLAFIFIAGILGLILDGGRLFFERLRAQQAADAGAIGGVHEMRRGYTQAAQEQGALDDAMLHGYSANEVTVNIPPASGTYAGNDNYVEVIVTKQFPTTFMRMIGPESASVVGRAVGGLVRLGDPCVYALNRVAQDALYVNGTANISADCGFQVNSNNDDAFRTVGGGCLTGTSISVVGDYDGNCINPTPITGTAPASDPLADLPEPDCRSMPIVTNAMLRTEVINGYTYTVIPPGRFMSTLNIAGNARRVIFDDAAPGANVEGAAGIYCLEQGMQIAGLGNFIQGVNVMFYNRGGSGGSGNISITGTTDVRLWGARDHGTYHGILFFGSREDPPVAPGNLLLGDNDSYYAGALYFPTQPLVWSGNPAGTSAWSLIVADTIEIRGNSGVDISIEQPTADEAPAIWAAVFFE